MDQPSDATPECGWNLALSVLKGKWKATLIWELHERPIRFGALRRRVAGISEKMLFEQLRQLEADGIVRREEFDEVPVRVEYSLTPAGAALNDAVHAMAEWAMVHLRKPGLARSGFGGSGKDSTASGYRSP